MHDNLNICTECAPPFNKQQRFDQIDKVPAVLTVVSTFDECRPCNVFGVRQRMEGRKKKSPDRAGLFLEARAGVEPAYTALQAAA